MAKQPKAFFDMSKYEYKCAEGGVVTLGHKDGHEIKIALKALKNPQLKAHLEAIIQDESKKSKKPHFDEGGRVPYQKTEEQKQQAAQNQQQQNKKAVADWYNTGESADKRTMGERLRDAFSAPKPKVHGARDSYDNDVVPKKLEEGGIVLPRSVTQAPDADKKAQMFVEAIFMGKPKLKKGK